MIHLNRQKIDYEVIMEVIINIKTSVTEYFINVQFVSSLHPHHDLNW